MQLPYRLASALVCSSYVVAVRASIDAKPTLKDIVMDIDIMGGVDDVGALVVANVFHNCGLASICGIVVNTHSQYGALAASTINTYYGILNVPIAASRPLTNETYFDSWYFSSSEYASKIAYNSPRSLDSAEDTPEPVTLYRQLLSAARDQSMTIVSLGFLDNLAALLDSTADSISSLSGPELISTKVRKLVVMGGAYPSSDSIHFSYEFNFGGLTPLSTQFVISNWPTSVPITYSGYEPGASIYAGPSPLSSPSDSPVLAAYQWYIGRGETRVQSWDPLTMLYAVLGLDGFGSIGVKNLFRYANEVGYNTVDSDGSNVWVNDTTRTNQHWLEFADGITNASVAAVLEKFYEKMPASASCWIG